MSSHNPTFQSSQPAASAGSIPSLLYSTATPTRRAAPSSSALSPQFSTRSTTALNTLNIGGAEEWKSIEAHRDVDETLCLSRKHAGSPLGVQRCPNNGHVLYVDVEDDVRGPTCVWVEEPPPDDFKLAATAEEADGRAGPPRELQSMVVVPCRAGRLLRFSGEAIHAVPRPSCEWLKDDDDAEQDGKAVAAAQEEDDDDEKRVGGVIPLGPPPTLPSKRRAVVLFNTWNVPPLVPSANDPPPPKAIDELESLECRLQRVSRLVLV